MEWFMPFSSHRDSIHRQSSVSAIYLGNRQRKEKTSKVLKKLAVLLWEEYIYSINL